MITIDSRQYHLQWFATIAAIFVGAIFLTNWPSYQFLILGGPIALNYYIIPGVFILPLIWVRPNTVRRFLREPSLAWFIFYVVSGLLWLLFADGYIDDVNRQWRLRFLSFFFFCTGLIITSEAEHRKVVWCIAACAVLATITYWLDFLFPFQFVPLGVEGSNPGRGAGFFINANVAGYSVIVMCIAAMPFVAMRFRLLVLFVMLAGVVPTFSRSAILFAAVVMLLWVVFKQLERRQILIFSVMAPLIISAGLVLFQLGLDAEGANTANLMERISFFSSAGEEVYDDSAEERRYVAGLAWQMFENNPLVGSGIGSTINWAASGSTHNMYLLFLAEQGMFGGALYLVFVFIVLFRGIRLLRNGCGQHEKDIGAALTLFGAYYTIVGFFSHNLLDDPHTLFLLAFLFSAELNASRVLHNKHGGN